MYDFIFFFFFDKNVSKNWEYIKNITDYNETGIFLTVTNVNYLQDTMKALSNKKESYIIVCSKHKLGDITDWKVITQQKLDDNNYLVLMKEVNS